MMDYKTRKMQFETDESKRIKELAAEWLAKNKIIEDTPESRRIFLSTTTYDGVLVTADHVEKHIVKVADNTPFVKYIVGLAYTLSSSNPKMTMEEAAKEIDRQRSLKIQYAFASASEERKNEILLS